MKAIRFNVSIPQFLALKIFGALNKGAYYKGLLSTVRLVDIPQPEIVTDEWVKIKVLRCGMCKSDVNAITLNSSPAWTPYCSFPSVLGHEVSGRIVEVGSAVEDLHAGDLVAISPVLNCKVRKIEPECKACLKGLGCCENFAEGQLATGSVIDVCSALNGGYSEYIVAHKSQVFKIPDSMSAESAALIEPFAIAVEAVFTNRPQSDEHVLVIGCGVIGNMVILALRALDIPCKITVLVSSDFTARLAKSAGADYTITGPNALEEAAEITGGKCYMPLLGQSSMMRGFDRVYDCLSNSDSVTTALRAARTGGVISLIGISDKLKYDPTMIWLKLLSLKGTTFYGFHEWEGKRRHVFEIAIDLVSKKNIKFQNLITHRFKLDEYRKMIDVNINKGKYKTIKTMFVFD